MVPTMGGNTHMTDTALVTTERLAPIRRLDPEDAIIQAKKWADALMRVVKETRISVNISGREYLKVEAWQTLARFNYCWIDTEWSGTSRTKKAASWVWKPARA